MRADGLVQRDELAAHAPAGDAVCVEVGVDVDGDVDDGCVGGLVGDGAAVVVVGGDGDRGSLVAGCVGWWGGEG